jgi:hypothetical protein
MKSQQQTSLLVVRFCVVVQVPEYAGYATAGKLFGFRTPQAAQAERADQAGEDPQDIAAEYAAATKAAAASANGGEAPFLLYVGPSAVLHAQHGPYL